MPLVKQLQMPSTCIVCIVFTWIISVGEYLLSPEDDKREYLVVYIYFFKFSFRPFQDYFISYETSQSVGGRKRENPGKEHLAHPQAVFFFFIKTYVGRRFLRPSVT